MLLCWFGTNIAEYLNWFCDILNFVCDNISLENQSLASSPTVRLCVRASVSNMESDVYIQPRKSFEGEC